MKPHGQLMLNPLSVQVVGSPPHQPSNDSHHPKTVHISPKRQLLQRAEAEQAQQHFQAPRNAYSPLTPAASPGGHLINERHRSPTDSQGNNSSDPSTVSPMTEEVKLPLRKRKQALTAKSYATEIFSCFICSQMYLTMEDFRDHTRLEHLGVG